MHKLAGILLAAALMAPAALTAQQQPGPGGRGRGMGMRNPVAIAVAHKADLGLSEQVALQLDSLSQQLQTKNAPLMKQMQDARAGVDFQSMTDDQRQEMRQKLAPVMQQVRANNEAARADLEKLLTRDQLQKLQDIVAQEMPQRGPRSD